MISNDRSNDRPADPLVTADIHCAGHLDAVLAYGLAPLRRRLQDELKEGAAVDALWLLRSARGGEHWQVRIHAPARYRARIEDLLRQETERCLVEIAPPAGRHEAGEAEAPDRGLRLTRYLPSAAVLGGEPLLSRAAYRARMTACLAAGTAQLLDAVEAAGAFTTAGPRLRLLLKALVTGIAALGFPTPTAAAYLAYHRDWSIRFPLTRDRAAAPASGQDAPDNQEMQETQEVQEMKDVLARLDHQAVRMAPLEEVLDDLVRHAWTGAAPSADSPWGNSLPDLLSGLANWRQEDGGHLDPFAPDPAFPPLFKVFHGLANQIGLTARDEAFAHHLLLRAVDRGRPGHD